MKARNIFALLGLTFAVGAGVAAGVTGCAGAAGAGAG